MEDNLENLLPRKLPTIRYIKFIFRCTIITCRLMVVYSVNMPILCFLLIKGTPDPNHQLSSVVSSAATHVANE